MFRFFILVTVFLLIVPNESAKHKKDYFIKSLKSLKQDKLTDAETCSSDSDCLTGFFCKNNDCIAKKQEGSLCLSGRNEECECGKCVLDDIQWIKICSSDSCQDSGLTKYNTCQSNTDCPMNYFCDLRDNGLCKSKVSNDKICYDDEMCICGKCVEKHYMTRPNKPPITYNVCSC